MPPITLRQSLHLALAFAVMSCLPLPPPVLGRGHECDRGLSEDCLRSLKALDEDYAPLNDAAVTFQERLLVPVCDGSDKRLTPTWPEAQPYACGALSAVYLVRPDRAPSRERVWQLVDDSCIWQGGTKPPDPKRDWEVNEKCGGLLDAAEQGLGDSSRYARWADQFLDHCTDSGRRAISERLRQCVLGVSLRGFALHPGAGDVAKVARIGFACTSGFEKACRSYVTIAEVARHGDPEVLEKACELGVVEGCAALKGRDPARAAHQVERSCVQGVFASCKELLARKPDLALAQLTRLCERGDQQWDLEACAELGARRPAVAAALLAKQCEERDSEGASLELEKLDPARAGALLDRLCDGGSTKFCGRLVALAKTKRWRQRKGRESAAVRLIKLFEAGCLTRAEPWSCLGGANLLQSEPELEAQLPLRPTLLKTGCTTLKHPETCAAIATDDPTPANQGNACGSGNLKACIQLACSLPRADPPGHLQLRPLRVACKSVDPTSPACLCAMKHFGLARTLSEYELNGLTKGCEGGRCPLAPGFAEIDREMNSAINSAYEAAKPEGDCQSSGPSVRTVVYGIPGNQTEWTIRDPGNSCAEHSGATQAAWKKGYEAATQVLNRASASFCSCEAQPAATRGR